MNIVANSTTRVLMAVLDGKVSVRSVAAAVGLGLSTTHTHLRRLRRLGLVDWTEGKTCTIHPICKVVR